MIFRSLFFLLVLVNLLVFTWVQGYWGHYETGHEPQRLGQQLNADSLKVQPTLATTTVSTTTATTSSGASPELACRIVSGLDEKAALGLKDAVASVGWKGRVLPAGNHQLHVVLIPNLANKAAAETKVGELQRRGVTEFKVVAFANHRHEIHFGSFHDEKSANAFLAKLAEKDVRTARIERRDAPKDQVELEVVGPSGDVTTRLSGKPFDGYAIRPCVS